MNRHIALSCALSLSACGATGTEGPVGPCGAITRMVPDDAATHHPQGTALTWMSNPPAAGPHFPVWAPYARAYDKPVPRGNYLHNLEHGGVALLYRCDRGCPDVVAKLTAIGQSLPKDPSCMAPINARWLLSPDPLLPQDVQVAAVAWRYTYQASCLDEATLRTFVSSRYGKGPEDTCADGAITWQ